MSTKTYPFSVRKHAHDIEYYHNHLFNTIHDMEVGTIPMDKERYDRMSDMYYGPLMELYEKVLTEGNGYTVQLTGAEIGLAKKIVAWASESRAAHLIEAGKREHLQYC